MLFVAVWAKRTVASPAYESLAFAPLRPRAKQCHCGNGLDDRAAVTILAFGRLSLFYRANHRRSPVTQTRHIYPRGPLFQ